MKKSTSIITSIGLIAALVLLDQYTKILALKHLRDQAMIDLIPGVFRLEYVENRGAAFGIMQNQYYFFAAITIVVLGLVAYSYYKLLGHKRYFLLRVLLVLLCAGAIGNLIDRLFRRFVVDFLSFYLINFPVFNVADCYVTVTAVLFIIAILFIYKEEEMDEISQLLFTKKKKGEKE